MVSIDIDWYENPSKVSKLNLYLVPACCDMSCSIPLPGMMAAQRYGPSLTLFSFCRIVTKAFKTSSTGQSLPFNVSGSLLTKIWSDVVEFSHRHLKPYPLAAIAF